MGFETFLNKFKKPVLIASGVVIAIAGVLYLIPAESEENEQQQKLNQQQLAQLMQQQQQQQQQQQMQQSMTSNTSHDEAQKQRAIEETLRLKMQLQKDIQLEYDEEGRLTLQSIKVIYQNAVLLALRKLIIYHDECIKQRQIHFDNMVHYFQITQKLYDYYFSTLNSALLTVVILLELKEDVMAQSKKFYEENGQLKPNYLRDLTWHFMSEEASKKEMTLDDYKVYLQYQIDNIQSQLDEINKDERISKIDNKAKKLVINGRVDDRAFFDLGFSDCDAIKALRKYITDPEVAELLKKRTETIELCC